jgi:hypothetical protein
MEMSPAFAGSSDDVWHGVGRFLGLARRPLRGLINHRLARGWSIPGLHGPGCANVARCAGFVKGWVPIVRSSGLRTEATGMAPAARAREGMGARLSFLVISKIDDDRIKMAPAWDASCGRVRALALVQRLRAPSDRLKAELQLVLVLSASLIRPEMGEGILRGSGAIADDSKWDRITDQFHRGQRLEGGGERMVTRILGRTAQATGSERGGNGGPEARSTRIDMVSVACLGLTPPGNGLPPPPGA